MKYFLGLDGKRKKTPHLKITVAWQGGISGLEIQNNSVAPRKAGYYSY